MEMPNGEFNIQIEDVTLSFREPSYVDLLSIDNKYSSLKWVEYLLNIKGLKLNGHEVTTRDMQDKAIYIPASFYTRVAKLFDQEVAKILKMSAEAEEKKVPTPT